MRLSAPVAISVMELIFLPARTLKHACQILMPMASSRTITTVRLNSVGVGARIFSIELLPSSSPTTMMITETKSPARYSMRACP